MRFDSDGKLLVSGIPGSSGVGASTDMTVTNYKLDEIKAHIDELETLSTVLRDRTPVLGQATAAQSSPVTLATDGAFAINFGSKNDPAAASDEENTGFLQLFKRHLKRLTSIIGLLPTGLSSGGRFLVDASIANFQDAQLITESPLTAVGSTPARSVSGYKSFTYQVDVSGIGTSVVVRMEGNLTGSAYDNLNPSNTDTTLTANKTYLFTTDLKINNIRFTLVNINGGNPSLQCYLLRGN